jgi:hypothetical protein
MSRVSLHFRIKRFIAAEFGSQALHFIRLQAHVQFRLPDGTLTKPYTAIFDTGAPWCVLPQRIWKPLDVQIHVPETTFGGVNQRKVCQIRASSATVRGRLVDEEGRATQVYDFPAYLAKSDRVPLIIGFANLLENFGTYFNPQTGEAWIEEQTSSQ